MVYKKGTAKISNFKQKNNVVCINLAGDRQVFFEDEEDNEMFLVTLKQYKKQSGYKLLAYCLMGNHIHLLIKIGTEEFGRIFRRIGASYVYWYNRKYDRTGHLFQDRYKSEAVENDNYLFAVLRYIHQNPLKAGIVKDIEDYPYSSYAEYLDLNDDQYVDKDFVLSLFHEEKEQALADFKDYSEIVADEKFLYINDRKHISDKMAIDMIKKKYKVSSSLELQNYEPEKRSKCVLFLLEKGLSARQIVRVTGISRYFIQKI